MQTMKFILKSVSPLMFGKAVMESKASDETHEQFEKRTWQLKVHVDDKGQVAINPFAVKKSLEAAGSRLNMKLTGKATYTKLFRQGILVNHVPVLFNQESGKQLKIGDVTPVPLFVPSDGKSGGSRRVMRIFPQILSWQATVLIDVLDARITEDIMRKHLEEAGMYIGFGSMRVENGGINGRFSVESPEAN